jgi:mannose-6-phosphate isomerase-like protein (cupin superfamily)
MTLPIVVQEANIPWATWPDAAIAARSAVVWKDLISGDRTASHALSLGIGCILPGHTLARHHHTNSEVYYVLDGTGMVGINTATYPVSAGTAVFIPEHALHHMQNTGSTALQFVYVFPVDSVQELVYQFVAEAPTEQPE